MGLDTKSAQGWGTRRSREQAKVGWP